MGYLDQFRARGGLQGMTGSEGTAVPAKAGSLTRKEQYQLYLKSDRWAELVAATFERDSHRCRMCNEPAQVAHHREYPEVFGNETIDDLTSLCHRCHHNHHSPPGIREVSEQCLDGTLTDCPCCHQKIKKLNPHRMCEQKWRLLDDIASLNLDGDEWIKVGEGHRLFVDGRLAKNTSYCAAVHARRLKWYGLIEVKGSRTAEYKVTELGYRFLAGHAKVPECIYCKGGKVVRESDEYVGVRDIKGVVLDKAYWDNYASIQC